MSILRIARAPWLSGLVLLFCGCSSGGDEGGASFFVETCSLGCSNGQGGSQVGCGVANTFENADVGLLFSDPVDLASVDKQSFQVFDVSTAVVPAGTFLLDSTNPRRLIFRPKLSFDQSGSPVFGFEQNGVYTIRLNGTSQKDQGPFVQSQSGRENEARVLCTITTDQGIIDPKPGKPDVALFVDTTSANHVPANGATNVKTSSKIFVEFDELMTIGTILVPATGQPPFITLEFDSDGLLSTTFDRSPLIGSFTYSIDQSQQTTLAIFTPLGGLPSGGSNPAQPRLVVVTVPASVTDIAQNGLGNPGTFSFAPVEIVYPPTPIVEDFQGSTLKDAARTGADWAVVEPGAGGNRWLASGIGGGSGRLGDLTVAANSTRTLITSARSAQATITLTQGPVVDDKLVINGVTFTFKKVASLPTEVTIQCLGDDKCPGAGCVCNSGVDLAWTVASMIDALTAYALANPGSPVAEATYVQSTPETMLVVHNTPGTAGNAFTLAVLAAGAGFPPGIASSPTLIGGSDGEVISGVTAITNFDFASNPGVEPPDELVADGTLEYARVRLETDSTLFVEGINAARLLARGDFFLHDTAVLDISGEDLDTQLHLSNQPYGQEGGQGGPGAGDGGDGGDRADQPNLGNSGGVTLASSILDGANGLGVGRVIGLGQGNGGIHWPTKFPDADLSTIPTTWFWNDMAVLDAVNQVCGSFSLPCCESHQMSNPGSGGAYAADGGQGVPSTDAPFGTLNKPPPGHIVRNISLSFTAAGTTASVGLEPPSSTPSEERLLQPTALYLRGGAGGGGGGTSIYSSSGTDFLGCFSFGISPYSDNSAAGGGGGGGAVQVLAGDEAQVNGRILATGGNGGEALSTAPKPRLYAAPGGAGSGGAVLLQARTLSVQAVPNRIQVPGGTGGTTCVPIGTSATCSTAGNGGYGLVRVESANMSSALLDSIAQSVVPIAPNAAAAINWMSGGTWSFNPALNDAASSFNGAQSCWRKLPLFYFLLDFEEDDPQAVPPTFGWNMLMTLELVPGNPIKVAYRGDPTDPNAPFLDGYPEDHWGQLFATGTPTPPPGQSAPIVVRFQGARTTNAFVNPCTADPDIGGTGIAPGSLTPWVRHPAELDAFFPRPDIVRFAILFDRSHPDFAEIKGVDDLVINTQPQ